MKLAQKSFPKMKQYVRNISVHNKQRGKHGKAFERFISDYFGFPTHEQHNPQVDVPEEIVCQGGVPKKLIGDWEVKYYNIKSKEIQLGDIARKLKTIKKGLVLVIGFWDGTPENLVDVKFYRIRTNVEILKMKKVWLQTSDFVKDKSNPIEETRELCKVVNRLHKGAFSVMNLSRNKRFSNSSQKWQNEARQVTLTAKINRLTQIA